VWTAPAWQGDFLAFSAAATATLVSQSSSKFDQRQDGIGARRLVGTLGGELLLARRTINAAD